MWLWQCGYMIMRKHIAANLHCIFPVVISQKWKGKQVDIYLRKCTDNGINREKDTAQKWSFPLRNFSVNMTKCAFSCGFDHAHWRNP